MATGRNYAVGSKESPQSVRGGLTQAEAVALRKQKPWAYIWKKLPSGSWQKVNVKSRLNPHRLTPVAFHIRGKRHVGKAKLVGGKVKIYVTAGVARKINPRSLLEYRVSVGHTQTMGSYTFPVYARTKAEAKTKALELYRDQQKKYGQKLSASLPKGATVEVYHRS